MSPQLAEPWAPVLHTRLTSGDRTVLTLHSRPISWPGAPQPEVSSSQQESLQECRWPPTHSTSTREGNSRSPQPGRRGPPLQGHEQRGSPWTRSTSTAPQLASLSPPHTRNGRENAETRRRYQTLPQERPFRTGHPNFCFRCSSSMWFGKPAPPPTPGRGGAHRPGPPLHRQLPDSQDERSLGRAQVAKQTSGHPSQLKCPSWSPRRKEGRSLRGHHCRHSTSRHVR